MRKHNYSLPLASGSVVAGGTIGSLIPPSGMFIIYGILTETSIGKMFAAGIIPGILLALFYMTAIGIWCRLDPNAGPRGPKYSWREKLLSFTKIGEVLPCLPGHGRHRAGLVHDRSRCRCDGRDRGSFAVVSTLTPNLRSIRRSRPRV